MALICFAKNSRIYTGARVVHSHTRQYLTRRLSQACENVSVTWGHYNLIYITDTVPTTSIGSPPANFGVLTRVR